MLKDMRDSIERLGMQCKEKSLAVVSGPGTRGDDGCGAW